MELSVTGVATEAVGDVSSLRSELASPTEEGEVGVSSYSVAQGLLETPLPTRTSLLVGSKAGLSMEGPSIDNEEQITPGASFSFPTTGRTLALNWRAGAVPNTLLRRGLCLLRGGKEGSRGRKGAMTLGSI
ncbi:hypothetical protein FRC03_000859 [Tulasnella sp. 419]|nr:hypothetical protein FRC03_000859 [Tulasnella sp. 419]